MVTGAKGDQPPYDPVAILKVRILTPQYNVSDARMAKESWLHLDSILPFTRTNCR